MPPKAVAAIKTVTYKNIRDYVSEESMLKSWGGKDEYIFSFEPEVLSENETAVIPPLNNNKKVCLKKLFYLPTK